MSGLNAFKKEFPGSKTIMIDRKAGELLLASRNPAEVLNTLIEQQTCGE